jgi:hypothetical protein
VLHYPYLNKAIAASHLDGKRGSGALRSRHRDFETLRFALSQWHKGAHNVGVVNNMPVDQVERDRGRARTRGFSGVGWKGFLKSVCGPTLAG